VLGLIKPESFSNSFSKWLMESVNGVDGKTLSFDGKTLRATAKIKCYKNPLHIVSAQIADYVEDSALRKMMDKVGEAVHALDADGFVG
jgi:hypothetical protein